MAETIAELRAMSKDDLIKEHDALAANVMVSTNHYLQELKRRDEMCFSRKILTYTRWITWMTVIIMIATLVNVWIFLS